MQQYIIDFVNDATEVDINSYLSACGATVLKTFSAFDKVVLVECESEPPVNAIVEHIKDDADHTNHIKLLTTVPLECPTLSEEGATIVVTDEQKDWWKVYSGSTVDLDAPSFQIPLSGAGAVVYLLDSGLKSDHPEFEGADIEYLYSITPDFTDRKGHGTALASLIVGKNCGITNAKLKVVKLFDTEVPTKLSDFLGALDAIYSDFTSINAYGIMNCSWAIERNEYVEAKMQQLFFAGVQIIVAAGNTGTDIGNVTPAAMPESIVVGSYNSSLLPSDFSDYTGTSSISVTSGSTNTGKLSGWAPGEDIYTATLDGGYGFSAGTSVAAAIHSAIIAYNMTLPAFNFDEDTTLVWNDATRNNVSFFIKKDLLLLDDPKYQNSPNVVSYLITDHVDPYNTDLLFNGWFAPVASTRITSMILFNPKLYSSVTLNEPLPAGMSINKYGIFSAYVPEPVVGTVDNPDRITYFVPITVVKLDGTSTDITLEIQVRNFEKLEKIPNEPNAIVPYTLNFISCGPVQFCAGQNYNFCDNYSSCPYSGGCFCGPKYTCACNDH
jgi:hypothetical protein